MKKVSNIFDVMRRRVAQTGRSLDVFCARHPAGALGVPARIAIPLAADWRWLLNREDTPWYPTMRLFRQKKLDHWPDVIERIALALARRLAHPATQSTHAAAA